MTQEIFFFWVSFWVPDFGLTMSRFFSIQFAILCHLIHSKRNIYKVLIFFTK